MTDEGKTLDRLVEEARLASEVRRLRSEREALLRELDRKAADARAYWGERDEAREALREVQWGGEWSRGIGEEVEQTCPGCGRRRSVGHAEACIVARALASRGDEGRQG